MISYLRSKHLQSQNQVEAKKTSCFIVSDLDVEVFENVMDLAFVSEAIFRELISCHTTMLEHSSESCISNLDQLGSEVQSHNLSDDQS